MKVSSIKEALKNLDNFKIIVSSGEETYYKEQLKHKIISNNPDHIYQTIDAEETDFENFVDRLIFKDLFGSKRIFLIKNANKIENFKFFLNLESEDIIILEADKIITSKINVIKEIALIAEFKKPPLWEEEKDIVGKITNFFKANGYEIEDSTAKYLYGHIGYNLYKLSNELQKLSLFKDQGNTITRNDIDSVGISNNKSNVFDIINFLIENNKKEALSLLDKVFKKQNPGILLISSWYSHFEKLLYLRTVTNKEISDISEFMEIHAYVIETKLKPQAKKFSTKKLLNILKTLANIELKIKQSSISIKLYLEKFILEF